MPVVRSAIHAVVKHRRAYLTDEQPNPDRCEGSDHGWGHLAYCWYHTPPCVRRVGTLGIPATAFAAFLLGLIFHREIAAAWSTFHIWVFAAVGLAVAVKVTRAVLRFRGRGQVTATQPVVVLPVRDTVAGEVARPAALPQRAAAPFGAVDPSRVTGVRPTPMRSAWPSGMAKSRD